MTILSRLSAAAVVLFLFVVPAGAQDLLTKKEVFAMAEFTTQSGRKLKDVKVGWESYGTLNADRSNAILICHFFSGSSHAAGKYAAADPAPTSAPATPPATEKKDPLFETDL